MYLRQDDPAAKNLESAEQKTPAAGSVTKDTRAPQLVTPKKKPKGRKLLAWQQEFNAQASTYRAAIEQFVGHSKAWRIFHTDYRRPHRTYRDAFDAARELFFFAITCGLNSLPSHHIVASRFPQDVRFPQNCHFSTKKN
jgi:hypothetical protein